MMDKTINQTKNFGEQQTLAAHKENDGLLQGVIKSMREVADITSLLRLTGALAMLVSMSMFLLQGWAVSNDLERFYTMLAQTGLLALAGFATTKLLQDPKSARLFFGLSLASITTNFTTLGALLYSVFPLDYRSANYADFAFWQATSGSAALISLAGALIILTPLSWLAFSVLARQKATELTKCYIGLNMLILVPIRELMLLLPILTIACWFVLSKSSLMKASKQSPFTWKTLEGRYAQLLLISPLIIIIGRSLLNYQIEIHELLLLSGLIYAVSSRAILKTSGLVSLSLFFIALGASTNFAGFGADQFLTWKAEVFVALCAFFWIDLYRQSSEATMKLMTVIAASVVMGFTLSIQQLFDASLASSLYTCAIALGMFAVSYQIKSKILFSSASWIMVIVVFCQVEDLLTIFAQSGWLGFAISGAIVIILASLLDRYGTKLRLAFAK